MEDWREAVINALRIVAAVSAAIFALLALFTDYKKDGKVTRYGRIAVIGIVVSAVSALVTQWAQVAWDHDKAEKAKVETAKERAKIDGQFQDQLAGLVRLNNQMNQSMLAQQASYAQQQRSYRDQQILLGQQQDVLAGNRRLNGRMNLSLVQQARLSDQARQAVDGINVTAALVNRGTAQTLETMWNDSNRIDSTGIQLLVGYVCPTITRATSFLGDEAGAQIGLRPGAQVDEYDFRPRQEFYAPLDFSPIHLSPYQLQTSSRRIIISGTGNDRMYLTRFSLFTPDPRDAHGQSFRDPETWRNGGIEVLVHARLNMSERDLFRLLPLMRESRGSWGEFNPPRQYGGAAQIRSFPCSTFLTVLVNGRTVLEEHPQMLLLSGPGTSFLEPTVVFRTYPRRIPGETFPLFPRFSLKAAAPAR